MTPDQEIQLQAFRQGFHAGADWLASRRRGRHRVDALTHASWRLGYKVGSAALDVAAAAFVRQLKAGPVDK